VKVRYAPFITVTHGVPFPAPADALFDRPALDEPALEASAFEGPPGDASAFEAAALAALAQFEPGRPVRLLGVRAEFADEPA
jgi:DNA polymerase-4